jgi:hypothetical protein
MMTLVWQQVLGKNLLLFFLFLNHFGRSEDFGRNQRPGQVARNDVLSCWQHMSHSSTARRQKE